MTIKCDTDTGIEMLYRGRGLHGVAFVPEVVSEFNQFADMLDLENITADIEYSKQFNIPQHYLELDVEKYIRNLTPVCVQAQLRVEQELEMFRTRNLFPVLQLMIYIVDTLRKHDQVWGVGRGSSVASYCLYLIGVHKIDSIRYDLDIREFLK